MIIDYQRKYVFVHVPKTGGDSITAALASTVVSGRVDTHDHKHLSAQAIRKQYFPTGDVWRNWNTWAVVREPAELIYSDWCFCREHYTRIDEHLRAGLVLWCRKLASVAEYGTFAEFADTEYPAGRGVILPYLVAPDGAWIVSRRWKLERLSKTWPAICESIGLDVVPELPRRNATKDKGEGIDAITRRAIKQRFRREYERLEYD